jgi:hypothetical protein
MLILFLPFCHAPATPGQSRSQSHKISHKPQAFLLVPAVSFLVSETEKVCFQRPSLYHRSPHSQTSVGISVLSEERVQPAGDFNDHAALLGMISRYSDGLDEVADRLVPLRANSPVLIPQNTATTLAWRCAGRSVGLFSLSACIFILLTGLWEPIVTAAHLRLRG